MKSNLDYSRGATSKRVASGEDHLRCSVPGQHNSEEKLQWWRVLGDSVRFDRPVN